MSRVREHLKKHKIAYIASGAAIGLGLAGATLAYDYNTDPQGGFIGGVKHWGMNVLNNHVRSLSRAPDPPGLNAGPNPLAYAAGFRDVGTSVYVRPGFGLAERLEHRVSLRGPNWGPLGQQTGRA